MCGIVGYIGNKNASEVLVAGLRRLEYRGYDSAGVAIMNGKGVELRRSLGKLASLEILLKSDPIIGSMGIGHTRWATHGRPSEQNAHPHACCHNQFFVVHNGIIENYDTLKLDLEKRGHSFRSASVGALRRPRRAGPSDARTPTSSMNAAAPGRMPGIGKPPTCSIGT